MTFRVYKGAEGDPKSDAVQVDSSEVYRGPDPGTAQSLARAAQEEGSYVFIMDDTESPPKVLASTANTPSDDIKHSGFSIDAAAVRGDAVPQDWTDITQLQARTDGNGLLHIRFKHR